MKITLITGNLGKVEEVNRYLGVMPQIEIDHQSLDLEEIQSLDIEEIVKDKAMHAYEKIGIPVLVEDSSLAFNTMGRLPGTLIKWFSQELGYENLCRLVDGKNRGCVAKVCYGFCDGKTTRLFNGEMKGTIADSPKGEGFGWSNIFIPEGYDRTYAEIPVEEKEPFAMRKIALKKFHDFLIENGDKV